jgi:hypothetical protein
MRRAAEFVCQLKVVDFANGGSVATRLLTIAGNYIEKRGDVLHLRPALYIFQTRRNVRRARPETPQ